MKGKNYFDGNVLKNKKYEAGENGYVAYQGSVENATNVNSIVKFNGHQGHGFAAERANNLIDKIEGRNAVIIGDDNAKNGPDRVVDGTLIQTKYCRTAADSINAAFHDGKYRYLDANGNAMQIEVPKDQYEDSLGYMRRRIAKGQVPGVTDPNDAERLIRKGNVDYKTACRIAKAGNIDSLVYDAANGSIVAVGAFGISGAITFAKSVWNGESIDKAIDSAVCVGIQSGGLTFVSSVITAQLTRTSVNEVILAPSIELVKIFPSSVRNSLVNSLQRGAMIYGNQATNNLAKLIRSNIIAAGTMLIVMSAADITQFVRGRISAKQLFKNIGTLATGMCGGYVGATVGGTVGSALGPVGAAAGTLIGGMVGGSAAGQAASSVLSNFVEDDAKEMLEIINQELVPLVEEFLLSEDELSIIIDELKKSLIKDKLLQMYASKDRNSFARELLVEQITKVVKWRVRISMPSDQKMIIGMGRVIELSSKEGQLQAYFASSKVNAQEMGEQLLGRAVSKCASDKAWYVTRQMNTIGMQQESSLDKMIEQERNYSQVNTEIIKDLNGLKTEFNDLIRSDKNA